MRVCFGLLAGGAIFAASSAGAQTAAPAPSTALPTPITTLGFDGSNRPSPAEAPVGPAVPTVPVLAQSMPANATRTQNPVTPLGIFTLASGVTTGSYYDDNVFATYALRRGDAAFFARPEVSAATSGTNYGFQSSAFVEGRKYATFSSEDQINAGATAAGVYQFDPDLQAKAQVDYLRGHVDRGTGESAFILLDRPIAFDQISGAAALNKRFDRYWTSIGATTTGVLYQNDSFLGLPINETYADVVIPTLTGRVGYVVAPLTSAFVDVTGNTRNFNYQPLSSVGYRTVAGLLFEPGPGARIKGETFGGYMHQDYQGTGLRTIDSWTYGVSMNFLVSNFLVFAVDGRREAKETPLFDGSLVQNQLGPTGGLSLIESSIGGRFDYQLLPNLVVGAGASYLNDSFQGTLQDDRYVSPLASVNYTVSKHVTVSLDYRRLEYRPDISGVFGFQKDVVSASVHGTF